MVSLLGFVTLSEIHTRPHSQSIHLDLVFQFLLTAVFMVACVLSHADFLSLSFGMVYTPSHLSPFSLFTLLVFNTFHFSFPNFLLLARFFFPFFLHTLEP